MTTQIDLSQTLLPYHRAAGLYIINASTHYCLSGGLSGDEGRCIKHWLKPCELTVAEIRWEADRAMGIGVRLPLTDFGRGIEFSKTPAPDRIKIIPGAVEYDIPKPDQIAEFMQKENSFLSFSNRTLWGEDANWYVKEGHKSSYLYNGGYLTEALRILKDGK